VLRLVRREARGDDEVRWDPAAKTVEAARLEGLDAVVHLSGESIADGRWTDAKKARLRSSRVGSTRFLSETLASLARKPSVLVSASAVGYYGDRGDAWLTETAPPATDFFGQLSVEWEAAAARAAHAGIRVVHPRTGVVLSPAGGALAKMLPPFKLGIGGTVGPGRQFFSWITLEDVVGAIQHVLARGDLVGAVNLDAPEPVTNAELTRTLGRVLGRPTVVPVPALALRIAFGEAADALLASTRMRPERLLATGYAFRFPELEGALRHVLGRKPASDTAREPRQEQ
jgi:hypothetical protein